MRKKFKLTDEQIEILLCAHEAEQLCRLGSWYYSEGCAAQVLFGIRDPGKAMEQYPALAEWFDAHYRSVWSQTLDEFASKLCKKFGT